MAEFDVYEKDEVDSLLKGKADGVKQVNIYDTEHTAVCLLSAELVDGAMAYIANGPYEDGYNYEDIPVAVYSNKNDFEEHKSESGTCHAAYFKDSTETSFSWHVYGVASGGYVVSTDSGRQVIVLASKSISYDAKSELGFKLAKDVSNGIVTDVTKIFKTDNEVLVDTINDEIDDALPIPLESKSSSFTAEDGHAYSVTLNGNITVTFPTVSTGSTQAPIFQVRFSNSSTSDLSVTLNPSGSAVVFDSADCGTVEAKGVSLMSAMWNGSAWDVIWKNKS